MPPLVLTDTTDSHAYSSNELTRTVAAFQHLNNFQYVHCVGIPHRSSHVEIVNASGEFFVWERRDGRLEIPGGHVDWIVKENLPESYEEAARRETVEELQLDRMFGSIEAAMTKLDGKLDFIEKAINQIPSSHLNNNEWVEVYRLCWPPDWKDPCEHLHQLACEHLHQLAEEWPGDKFEGMPLTATWMSLGEIKEKADRDPMKINAALRLLLRRNGIMARVLLTEYFEKYDTYRTNMGLLEPFEDAYFDTYASEAMRSRLAHLQDATEYRLCNMQPVHLKLWPLKQMCLTDEIVKRAWGVINKLKICERSQADLKKLLRQLGQMAFPLFVAGIDANPVHHNFQTIENMLLILLEEDSSDYQLIKNAAILALLHDIGNGFVAPNLKKIKSSDIKDRRKELASLNKSKDEIDKELSTLIQQAQDFRKAHMKIGAIIARDLLSALNHDIVTPDDINAIADCIEQHDNPSIAELRQEIGMSYGRSDLIPLDNPLACLLREADRLWMVSREGLEKDLFDDLRKGKRPDPCAKLFYNVGRFRDEYKLYAAAHFFSVVEKNGFQHETLFRTKGGFAVCKRYVRERLSESLGRVFIDV